MNNINSLSNSSPSSIGTTTVSVGSSIEMIEKKLPHHNSIVTQSPNLGIKRKHSQGSRITKSSTTGERMNICEAACLDIIENGDRQDDNESDQSSCKVCAVKQASNAFRLFESIPLSVKLLLLVICSIICLVGFGAYLITRSVQTIEISKRINKLMTVSVAFTDFIDALQAERGFGLAYYSVRVEYDSFWANSINNTNIKLNNIQNNLKSDVSKFVTDSNYFNEQMNIYIKQLPQHRYNIWNFKYNTSNQIIDFYTQWNELIVDGIHLTTQQIEEPTFKDVHTSFGYAVALKETLDVLRTTLTAAMASLYITIDNYNYAFSKKNTYDLLNHLFYLTARKDIRDIYAGSILNSQTDKTVNYMINEILLKYNNLSSTDFDYYNWYFNVSDKFDQLQKMETFLRQETLLEAKSLEENATTQVIIFTIVTVFVVFLSVVMALFFSRTIVVPWKRLLRLQKQRTNELSVSYSQLGLLLERISTEEQKTKKILNSIEDALVTINTFGNIIYCNSAFYKMFKFQENDIFGNKKLYIQQIVPNLDIKELFENLTNNNNNNSLLDTVISPNKDYKAITKVGKDFPVRVNLNFCNLYVNDFIQDKDNLDTNKIIQQERACIILIHDLSDKLIQEKENNETLFGGMTKERIQFQQMFDNTLMRLDFKEFSKRFKTEENISFLEDVQVYKHTNSLQERVQRQNDIYNNYLKPDAKKLLNISKEQLELYSFKTSKGLGEIDLFESLEKIVIENMLHDSFKRWKEMEKDLENYM
ncbi:hypothetical protein ABK040_003924 [Willaertia magna]